MFCFVSPKAKDWRRTIYQPEPGTTVLKVIFQFVYLFFLPLLFPFKCLFNKNINNPPQTITGKIILKSFRMNRSKVPGLPI